MAKTKREAGARKDLIPKELSEAVTTAVMKVYSIPGIEILRDTSQKRHSSARQAAAYAFRNAGKFSLASIGKEIGVNSLNSVSTAIANAKKLQGEARGKVQRVLSLVSGLQKVKTGTILLRKLEISKAPQAPTPPPPEEEAESVLVRARKAVHEAFLPDDELFSGTGISSAGLTRQVLVFVLVADYNHEPDIVGAQIGMNKAEVFAALGTVWYLARLGGETREKLEAARRLLRAEK